MKLSAILIALPLVIGTASCKQQPKQSAEKVANTETKTSNNNNSGKEKKMEVQEMTAQMFKEKVMNYEKNPNTYGYSKVINPYSSTSMPHGADLAKLQHLS